MKNDSPAEKQRVVEGAGLEENAAPPRHTIIPNIVRIRRNYRNLSCLLRSYVRVIRSRLMKLFVVGASGAAVENYPFLFAINENVPKL